MSDSEKKSNWKSLIEALGISQAAETPPAPSSEPVSPPAAPVEKPKAQLPPPPPKKKSNWGQLASALGLAPSAAPSPPEPPPTPPRETKQVTPPASRNAPRPSDPAPTQRGPAEAAASSFGSEGRRTPPADSSEFRPGSKIDDLFSSKETLPKVRDEFFEPLATPYVESEERNSSESDTEPTGGEAAEADGGSWSADQASDDRRPRRRRRRRGGRGRGRREDSPPNSRDESPSEFPQRDEESSGDFFDESSSDFLADTRAESPLDEDFSDSHPADNLDRSEFSENEPREDSDQPRKRRRRRRGGRGRKRTDGGVESASGASADGGSRSGRSRDDELHDEGGRSFLDDEPHDDDRHHEHDDDFHESDEERGVSADRERSGRDRVRGGRHRQAPVRHASAHDADEVDDDHEHEDERLKSSTRDVVTWKEAIGFIVTQNMEARSRSPRGSGGPPKRHHRGKR